MSPPQHGKGNKLAIMGFPQRRTAEVTTRLVELVDAQRSSSALVSSLQSEVKMKKELLAL